MLIPKDKKLLSNARNLRRNMTKQERRLWYDFLRHYPIKFYKQRIVDNYIVDFYCHQAKLVIELDGSQHFTDDGQRYDRLRTDIIEKYKLSVLRFTNKEVDEQFEGVCTKIDQVICERCTPLSQPDG